MVTNTCDVCLLRVKVGQRDQFLTQLARELRKARLLSTAIAALPSIFEVFNCCLEL